MIAIIEPLLFGYMQGGTVDIGSTWEWANRAAVRDAPSSQILCFGDSLVKFGVVPRIIERQTKLSTSNLAVFEGRPATSYFLLKKALEAGSQPTAIVLDNGLLYKNPVQYPGIWPELASPAEAASLAWVGRDPDFLIRYSLSRQFASIRYRDELRSAIASNFDGVEPTGRLFHRLNQRNWTENQGAALIPSNRYVREPEPKELNDNMVLNDHWLCHPVNQVYNTKFLDLAQSRGIPVFWVIPPCHPGLAQRLDRPTWNGNQRQFLLNLQEKYENLIVVDGSRSNYDATVLSDLAHLNRRGACAFSTSLGLIIRDGLAAGSGQRAAGSGQRAAGSGQRAAGSGQRAAGAGLYYRLMRRSTMHRSRISPNHYHCLKKRPCVELSLTYTFGSFLIAC